MIVKWDDWQTQFRTKPSIKVDGKAIRNFTVADDERRIVISIKGKKQIVTAGNVEIIGERI